MGSEQMDMGMMGFGVLMMFIGLWADASLRRAGGSSNGRQPATERWIYEANRADK